MLGDLYVELTTSTLIGKWLKPNSRTATISQSNIASGGNTESFIKVLDTTRTR